LGKSEPRRLAPRTSFPQEALNENFTYCGSRNGESNGVFSGDWRWANHLTGKVGHEETGEKERCWNTDISDILLNIGLGVEVVDLAQLATGNYKTPVSKFITRWGYACHTLGNVEQTAPDEMLNIGVLACICHILSLLDLNCGTLLFPEVGNGEDTVRTIDGLLDRAQVVQIRLNVVKISICLVAST
jgi:hypothetical protein